MHDPDYNPAVPAHVPAERVHDFNVFDYDTKDPFLAINDLFEQKVPELFWTRNQGGHWLVLGADAISELGKADPAVFSAKRLLVPDNQNGDEPLFPPNDTDPPLHTAYRAAIAPLFTSQRVDLLKEDIRALTRQLAAEFRERGRCEFMEDFAATMPITVFLKVLNLPNNDRIKLRAIAHRVINPVFDGNRVAPMQELNDYLAPYITSRMACPQENDAISYVIAQKVGGRRLELAEIVKLTRSMLLAGLDTVVGMLGYFARYLADTPPARRRLIDHPESINAAVEEVLRRFPVVNIGRYVARDVVFRGVEMKAGDHIMWPVGMYNFDERRFPGAMSVQLDRANNRHASFGISHHFCVGAVLARAELRIFAEEWLREVPDFHVAPGGSIGFRGGFTKVYSQLPLELGA